MVFPTAGTGRAGSTDGRWLDIRLPAPTPPCFPWPLCVWHPGVDTPLNTQGMPTTPVCQEGHGCTLPLAPFSLVSRARNLEVPLLHQTGRTTTLGHACAHADTGICNTHTHTLDTQACMVSTHTPLSRMCYKHVETRALTRTHGSMHNTHMDMVSVSPTWRWLHTHTHTHTHTHIHCHTHNTALTLGLQQSHQHLALP